jgi:hypothetical protein
MAFRLGFGLSVSSGDREAHQKETLMAERLSSVAHIRFEGRSLDIPLGNLDVGPQSRDEEIKRALAAYLEVPANRLRDYVVDRHETGNLTIRPAAVFG